MSPTVDALERALARCRARDAEAHAGWPGGYDRTKVVAGAMRDVRILDEAATSPEIARSFVEQLHEVSVAW